MTMTLPFVVVSLPVTKQQCARKVPRSPKAIGSGSQYHQATSLFQSVQLRCLAGRGLDCASGQTSYSGMWVSSRHSRVTHIGQASQMSIQEVVQRLTVVMPLPVNSNVTEND
jgi:hypothetical protein